MTETEKHMNAAKIAALYDRIAPVYRQYYADYDQAVRKQGKDLSRLLFAEGFGRADVLDCSCGIGTQAIGLALEGHSVTGCDISPASIDEAERNADLFGAPAHFFVADMRALPHDLSASHDAVVSCGNSIAHLISDEDMAAFLQGVSRTLRPGGVFLAALTDHENGTREEGVFYDAHVQRDADGKTVNFQLWTWIEKGLTYICDDYTITDRADGTHTEKVSAPFRIWRRAALFGLAEQYGFTGPAWLVPADTGHHNPILRLRKKP